MKSRFKFFLVAFLLGCLAGVAWAESDPKTKPTKEESAEIQASLTDLKNALGRLEKAVDGLADGSSKRTKEKITAELRENTSKLEKQINRLQKDIEGNTQDLVQNVQEGLSNVFGELSRVLSKASQRLKPEDSK